MPILQLAEIEPWVEEKIVESVDGSPSIYDQRYGLWDQYPNHQYTPRCMYFFYVRVNGNGSLKVDHYFYHGGSSDDPAQWPEIRPYEIKDLVARLALNARPLGAGVPAPLPDHNFENIRLQRKSYVAFFLDEANWAFHKRDDGNFAMAYNRAKSGGAENYSFFDGMDLELTLPITGGGEDRRTGVCLINHMKADAAGTDLPNTQSAFAFDMYFNVAFADPTDKKLTVIFDPGGTNDGPPIQP